MIICSASNIDLIQGALGYGDATEGINITDWRISNTQSAIAGQSGVFSIFNSSSITPNISIVDNGTVGIGTVPSISSTSKMEIVGNVNITGAYNINNRNVINDTSNYILATSNLLAARIQTTSNALVSRIDTKQNTINSTAGQLIIGNGNGSTTTNASLTFTNNDTLNAPKFVGNGSGLTNLPSASQWTGTNPIYYTAGNVGIGTTNPANELHIFDSITSNTSIIIQNNTSTLGVPSIELIRGTSGDSNIDYKIGNYDGDFKVISSTLTTDIERLNITSGNYTTALSLQSISPLPTIISSTPVATTSGLIGTDRYMIFTYTTDTSGYTNQTLYTITLDDNYTVDILVVGGGGGGGQGVYCGGGGGGGGIVYMVDKTLAKGSYKIIVGKGGAAGTVGNDSVIRLSNDTAISYDSISVVGKGGGAGAGGGGGSGGSGGGGSNTGQGAGTATQGNTFWDGTTYVAGGFNGGWGGSFGGGGGGAGEAGGTDGGPQGGDGRLVNITGTNTFYGGGGGGGEGGGGGDGGGGGTGNWGSSGGAGTPNTGGGGGGVYSAGQYSGGIGGSGIIIIRYRQNLPVLETSINLVRGNINDTNTDYKIGNFNGDFKIISSSQATDIERLNITSGTNTTQLALRSISPFAPIISFSPLTGTTSGIVGTDRYIIFTYTTNTGGTGLSEYTITLGINYNVDLLVVGGGGGGGQGSYENGGGGGGGIVYMVDKTLVAGTYKVIVGNGGGAATVGYDSRITLNGTAISYDSISVVGKGGGPAGGGSGGSGAGGNKNGGAGSATQGNTFWNGSSYVAGGFNGQNGGAWNGGGGGGAGEAGGTDGGIEGGDGRAVSITGVNTFYGGGGAGGGWPNVGGDGGGGVSGGWGSGGGAGTPNTGGGGGGAFSYNMGPGGVGGSGIVIIRYRQSLPQLETSINLVRGTAGDTNRDYKIGNYNGDFIIKSSVSNTDTDYLKISSTGAITNPTGTASWNTGSDRRIKENIERASYDKCYESICRLELNRFNYIKGFNTVSRDNKQLGFIAQEVYDIFPKAISSQPYNSDTLSIPDLLSIDVSQINYALYGTVKKLIEINNNKELRLKKLECLLNVESDSEGTSNVVIDDVISSNVIVSEVIEDTMSSNVIVSEVIEDTISSNVVVSEVASMTSNVVIE
jgi:hypothetical protein